jgi:raffinose/stachyose/melibiose transport system substrate-binding protein
MSKSLTIKDGNDAVQGGDTMRTLRTSRAHPAAGRGAALLIGHHRRLVLAAVTIPVAAALLTACSSGGGSSASSANGSDPAVMLTILSNSSYQLALPVMIKDFEAKYPNVNIQATYVPSANYTALIGSQFANGTAADIVSVSAGGASAQSVATLGKNGYLKDLSNQPWAKDVPAGYSEAMGLNGKTYVPAIAMRSISTFYNETVMKKYGFKIPQTFSNVLSLCTAASAKGIAAYTIGAATDYENQMLPFALGATLVPNTKQFIADRTSGATTFAGSAWLTIFQREDQMLQKGCFAKDPDGTSINAAQAEVANGQALSYIGQSNQYPMLTKLGPSATFASTSFPATNNPSDTRLAVAIESSFGINAKLTGDKLEVAERFFDFMMQPAENRKLCAALGDAPALSDPGFVTTPGVASLVQFTQEDKTSLVPDQFFPNPNVRTVWITTNEKMLAGQATPNDIVTAMDKAWDTGQQ